MTVPWTTYDATTNYTPPDGCVFKGVGYNCIQENGPSSMVAAPTDDAYWHPTIISRIDWTPRLLGRLYTQFVGKPKIEQIVRLKAAAWQALEDTFLQLLTLPSIDDSVGAQLDNLGKILNMPRMGATDPNYRPYLKAKIAALRSSGTPEALYRVFRALLADNVAKLIYAWEGPAQMSMTLVDPTTSTLAAVALSMLRIAKFAGVRAWIIWQESADADTFCFDGGTGKGFDDGSGTVGGQLAGVST